MTSIQRIAIFACVLLLAGCASEERKQAASDAHAGVDALEQMADDPAAPDVATGTKAHIETASGIPAKELPPPTVPAEKIPAQAREWKDDAVQRRDAAFAGIPWWGWLSGGVVTLLTALRAIPGAHQVVIGPLLALLENRKDKASRKAQEAMARTMPIVVDAIERGSSIPEVKQFISRQVGLDPDAQMELLKLVRKVESQVRRNQPLFEDDIPTTRIMTAE